MEVKLIAFVFVVESSKVSPTYQYIIHKKFVDSFEKQGFVIAQKMLARDGPRGEPIVTPSIF